EPRIGRRFVVDLRTRVPAGDCRRSALIRKEPAVPRGFTDAAASCAVGEFVPVVIVGRSEPMYSTRTLTMRIAAATLIGALGLAASVVSANAAPAAPAPLDPQNIIQVAGGCGWGMHPNRWGGCMPNRYGFARPYPYSGGGYYRSWGWRSPSDRVA